MEPMIKLEHLDKTFTSKNQTVKALSDINLEIQKGDIFGIIGMSGAGKSTLIRCTRPSGSSRRCSTPTFRSTGAAA